MILAREIPFVKIVIPLMLGIAIAFYLPLSFSILLPGLIISFLFLFLAAFIVAAPNTRVLFAGNIYLFFFLLGCVLMKNVQRTSFVSTDLVGQYNSYVLQVNQSPKYGSRIQVHANITAYGSGEKTQAGDFGKVYVSLEKQLVPINIQKGDLLFATGKLQKSRPPLNPNTFDFKDYLSKQGIHHQMFIKKDEWRVLRENDKFSIVNLAKRFQEKCVEIFNQYIPSQQESAIVKALILGNKSDLDPSVRDAYASTGALHVLAVSGLHVGLMYGFLFLLVQRLNKRKWYTLALRMAIPLLGIWAFTFISGATPSVVRASLMLSLVLIAKNIRRYPSIYNTIAFTAFVMLLLDPYQLFNVSFQLSFLALTGIIYFQPKIYRLWFINNFVGDKLWMLCSVGIAAQLGTFPIAVYYFHQFPIYFWLSGVIVVPAASIILGLGILLLFSHFVLPLIASLIAKLLSSIVWLMNALIFLIQSIPNSSLDGIWISSFTTMALYAIILCFAVGISFRKKKILFAALFGLLLLNAFQLVTKMQQPAVNKLVIYGSSGNTIIDYFRNKTAHTYESEGLQNEVVKKIATPFRSANNINRIRFGIPNKNPSPVNSGVEYYQLNGKRFAIINKKKIVPPSKKINLDFLILTSNPEIDISKLIEKFQPEYIIFDSSNYPWNIDRWQKELEGQLPIEKIINIRKNGACILDFEINKISQKNGLTLDL